MVKLLLNDLIYCVQLMSDRFLSLENKIIVSPSGEGGCLPVFIVVIIFLVCSWNAHYYIITFILFVLAFLILGALMKGLFRRKKLSSWFKKNEGAFIFFYPTNKVQQQKIQAELSGKLTTAILQIYYNGPQLVGDIVDDFVIQDIFRSLNKKNLNAPKFLKVEKSGIYIVCSLDEFLVKEWDGHVIDELIKGMNARCCNLNHDNNVTMNK